jgi:hypothetical protein
MEAFMRRVPLYALCFLACTMQFKPPPARSAEMAGADHQPAAVSHPLRLAQLAQCSRRLGPFATQDTAWSRWREAQGGGFAVSNGVYPCYENWARGYCFNVFLAC